MKTLREFELELKVHELEHQLREFQGKAIAFGYADDIDYSRAISIKSQYGDLPMAAQVLAVYGHKRLSVVLETVGCKDTFRHAYYLDREVTADKRHLEQALVSMHEKVIYQILRNRLTDLAA
jgi:hypothetical protein